MEKRENHRCRFQFAAAEGRIDGGTDDTNDRRRPILSLKWTWRSRGGKMLASRLGSSSTAFAMNLAITITSVKMKTEIQ